ncbi:hypothetical protein [Nocardioides sp. GY 10127]|uniref:hypothetical protein n=1 Tax=Nocardioides sp. GY 10127 TaxID=2569762 RepID=UPI0010A92E97|nr:hypothetical protein [Nocardioides sp. GY 10127]TIC85536.1 hypothetical protein E8D37_02580 [Nocardioides sp. GY 10127]
MRGCADNKITVEGVARRRGGTKLKKHRVLMMLHKDGTVLGGFRSNKKGFYSGSFCRTKTLKTYAAGHNGHLNIDILARKGDGTTYVRTITTPVGRAATTVGGKFVPVRTYASASRTAGRGVATGDPIGHSSLVNPGVMFVQAVPHMTAQYYFGAKSKATLEATVGAPGDTVSIAGEVSLSGETGFGSLRELNPTAKKRDRAVTVHPQIEVTNTYTCPSYNPYAGGFGVGCLPESSGDWTGEVTTKAATFKGCFADSDGGWYFGNRSQREFITTDGVEYNNAVSAGAGGSSLKVSVTYGSDTYVKLVLDKTKKRHRYCIGGNADLVKNSSALYLNLRDKTTGSGCRSDGGTDVVTCRKD